METSRFHCHRSKERFSLGRDECFKDMHCYRGRHTSRGDKRSNACSLPFEQYVHVIYGGVIHVSIIGEFRIWKWQHSTA